MTYLVDTPVIWFFVVLVFLYAAARLGQTLQRRRPGRLIIDDKDFDLVVGATLTLLGLIIGFTFSMAVTRYDQRKNLEEAEANAIGTAYLRADLLPEESASRTRELLRKYLDLRIAFYEETATRLAAEIGQQTASVQNEMWSVVKSAAASQPTPPIALVVSSMNDVINAHGFTQAAWWNRIPTGAWAMMALMAVSCNLLVGYGERRKGELFLFVLPVVISLAFFLIADLDSPRGGVIRVHPQNLLAAALSMKPPP